VTGDELRDLLASLQAGDVSLDDVVEKLRSAGVDDLGFARLDTDREKRTGIAEVIFAPGKSLEQLEILIERSIEHHGKVLVSRLDEARAGKLREKHPEFVYNATGRLLHTPVVEERGLPLVAVVSAGTSDQAVAEEAAAVLEYLGHEVDRFFDVGVAGIHRLFGVLDRLRDASALVVAAGMEGALPSVVAGLVSRPVVAVPTSVGYGASFGGVAALLGMLNSCAGGVGVVNIDNGFGAAVLAHRIAPGE